MNISDLQKAIVAATNKYYPFVEDPAKNPRVWPSDVEYYKGQGAAYYKGHFTPNIQVTPCNTETGGIYVSVGYHGITLLRFYLQGVNACCAMSFFHSFIVGPNVDKAWLKEVMDATVKAQPDLVGGTINKRWIVNMVESGRSSNDPMQQMEPTEKPVIKYPELWEYFHTNAKRVNTMLMPNANTSNIIHHMEVLF